MNNKQRIARLEKQQEINCSIIAQCIALISVLKNKGLLHRDEIKQELDKILQDANSHKGKDLLEESSIQSESNRADEGNN